MELEYFDGIVTNFPFEDSQDIKMARWCFDNLLTPTGYMVAILSGTALTKSYNLNKEFAQWVADHGWHEQLPQGSFDGRYSGISGTMIVVRKD